jgi:UDP-glucose 4-epimerase
MHSLVIRYASSRYKIPGVIHFTAFKSVSECIVRPLAPYRYNVCGLVELPIQEGGISSSATVYGKQANAGKLLQQDDLVHFNQTNMSTNGNVTKLVNGARGRTSPYGRTKHFAETILVDVTHADPR